MTYVLAIIAISIAILTLTVLKPKPREVSSLPSPSQDVIALIGLGEKVAAIRAYRKQTGASLLEARRVVELYAA